MHASHDFSDNFAYADTCTRRAPIFGEYLRTFNVLFAVKYFDIFPLKVLLNLCFGFVMCRKELNYYYVLLTTFEIVYW